MENTKMNVQKFENFMTWANKDYVKSYLFFSWIFSLKIWDFLGFQEIIKNNDLKKNWKTKSELKVHQDECMLSMSIPFGLA